VSIEIAYCRMDIIFCHSPVPELRRTKMTVTFVCLSPHLLTISHVWHLLCSIGSIMMILPTLRIFDPGIQEVDN